MENQIKNFQQSLANIPGDELLALYAVYLTIFRNYPDLCLTSYLEKIESLIKEKGLQYSPKSPLFGQ